MRPDQLYHELKNLAERLGITVKEHNLKNSGINVSSGLCRVNDRHLFIMDKRLPIREKTAILAECIGEMETDGIYMVPALRDLLEKYRKNKTRQ